MSVKNDILKLVQVQEDLFEIKGRYVQVLKTPENIPAKGSLTNITELRRPSDETEKIPFIPAAKDYQFRVDVWSRFSGFNKEGFLDKDTEEFGFTVTAKRDLGDGITETITTKDKSLG